MADTTALKNRIRSNIKSNDNQEITGAIMQETLLDIVDELSDNLDESYVTKSDFNSAQQVQDTAIQELQAENATQNQSIAGITTNLEQNVESIAQINHQQDLRLDAAEEDIDEVAGRVQTAETNINSHTQQLTTLGDQLNNVQNTANTAKSKSDTNEANVQMALDSVSEIVGNTDYLETHSSGQVVDLNNLQVVNLFVGKTDWLYFNDGSESFIIDATEISAIQITASDTLCPVFLLKSTEISQGTADLCYNEIGRRTILANTTTYISLPKDCVAIGIGKNAHGVSYAPSNITIFPSTRKAISELLVCKDTNKIVPLVRGGWNYETGAPITNARLARTRSYIDLLDVYGVQMAISTDVAFGNPESVRVLKYHDDILVGHSIFDFEGTTALITLFKDVNFNKIKVVILGSSSFSTNPSAFITCREIISNSDVCNTLPSTLEKLKNNVSISNYSDTGFFEFIGYNANTGLPTFNQKLASSPSIFVHSIFKATLNLPITVDSITIHKYNDTEYVGRETFDSTNSLLLNVDYSFNRVIIQLYYSDGFTDEIVSECSYSYTTGSLNIDEEHSDNKSVKDKEIDYVKSLQTKTRILTLEEQEMVPTTGVNIRYYNGHLLLTVDGVESEIVASEVEHFPFEGKRISFMGDSITTFSDYPGSYNPFYTGSNAGVTSVEDTWWGGLCSALHSSINRIYAYGGGKIRDICSNYDKLFSNGSSGSAPDFIFILVGINDWGHNTTIGAITDSEGINTTFYGSYKYLLSHLRETYPNAQIITLTLLNSMYFGTTYPLENNDGKALNDYNNAIKECSEFYSVPCLELNKLVNINGFNYTTYLEDYTHPKKVGMEIITKAIKNNIYNLTTV